MATTEELIYVIRAEHRVREGAEETLQQIVLVDEGYFLYKNAAEYRAEQLDRRNDSLYAIHLDKRRREHEIKLRAAEQHNTEAAVLRAAGIDKDDIPLPELTELTFAEFIRSLPSSTTYHVVGLTSSEYDVFRQSRSAGQAEGADETTA